MTYSSCNYSRLSLWRPLSAFAIGIFAIGFAYTLALPGYFLFDDAPNLERLGQAVDWRSQLSFIFSGDSGPLGRPISLATFVLQKSAWPDHPGAMLSVNIGIHLFAVGAVFLLAFGLTRIRPGITGYRSLWIATAVALLWGLSPFLATTHLMIIQRMTSLAGMLIFLGLAGFVWAHLIAKTNPGLGLSMLVLSLSIGTLLATLAKENGALLPPLAILILWLWIPKDQYLQARTAHVIFIVLAVVPALLLLGYMLFYSVQVLENGYGPHRQFTPGQRLLTQIWILLDYLQNLLIPRASNVSPFTDDITPATGWLSPPITLIALLVWVSLISIVIKLRAKAAYLQFGLFFFLAAHIMESSIIGLELYFPHRNYIASFGIYFAIVYGIASLPSPFKRISISALGVYTILFLLVLMQATSNWNQVGLTSETWLNHKPNSLRAAQFLANKYLKFGDPITALQILDGAAQRNPNNAMIKIQQTLICAGREDRFREDLAALIIQLRSIPLTLAATSELATISMGNLSRYCPQLKNTDISEIADALLENPSYQHSDFAKGHLLIAKGFAEAEQDNIAPAINLFVESFRTYQHLDTLFIAVSLMSNAGEHARAAELLSEVRKQAPTSYIRKLIWLQRIDAFNQILEQSRLIDEAR